MNTVQFLCMSCYASYYFISLHILILSIKHNEEIIFTLLLRSLVFVLAVVTLFFNNSKTPITFPHVISGHDQVSYLISSKTPITFPHVISGQAKQETVKISSHTNYNFNQTRKTA
mgnify:CR=1 FL=1